MVRRLFSPSTFAFAAVLACAPSPLLWSQASVLPPNPATQIPPAATAPAQPANAVPSTTSVIQPAPLAATPALSPGHHAYVGYADGLLDVRANNSSLNVILRDIARQTGMTITGGVADQRVFGNYGPANPGVVLATLLDGTGVNVFVREADAERPAELVLTPRTGGPTPPSPSSNSFDAEAAAEALPPAGVLPAQPGPPPGVSGSTARPVNANNTTPTLDPNAPAVTTPPSSPQPWNNPNGSPANTSPTASSLPTANSVPLDSVPTPATVPPSSGIVDAPNSPPAGTTVNPAGSVTSTTTVAPDGSTTTTTTVSPNGVRTPDEIYQQLLKLQQGKAGQQPASGSTPSGSGSTATTPTTQP